MKVDSCRWSRFDITSPSLNYYCPIPLRESSHAMDITNEQAQALFDAGGFIVLTGLPEGSEVGIDGT